MIYSFWEIFILKPWFWQLVCDIWCHVKLFCYPVPKFRSNVQNNQEIAQKIIGKIAKKLVVPDVPTDYSFQLSERQPKKRGMIRTLAQK